MSNVKDKVVGIVTGMEATRDARVQDPLRDPQISKSWRIPLVEAISTEEGAGLTPCQIDPTETFIPLKHGMAYIQPPSSRMQRHGDGVADAFHNLAFVCEQGAVYATDASASIGKVVEAARAFLKAAERRQALLSKVSRRKR